MSSLADVAPPELLAEEFDLRGTLVKVRGLSGEEWMNLYTRFPELAAALSGQPAASMTAIDDLRSRAAIIAAAVGSIGDAKTEALVLANLSDDEHKQLVEAAFRLSHPGHTFGPLLNGAGPNPAPNTEAPATK